MIDLRHGDSLEVLKELDDNSVDSCVTDPPYELNFMSSKWDNTGIAYNVKFWSEVYRVLKPGAHLLSFGATRTYHRMTVAIEDAGFEIRDSIHWSYGQGFPKNHDVSKAIDKEAGAEREDLGPNPNAVGRSYNKTGGNYNNDHKENRAKKDRITAPATEKAKKWDGWGTALKPSHEPIVLARKPFDLTVAQNVQKYGTSAINIDDCRIETGSEGRPKRVIDPKESANGVVYAGRRNAGTGFDGGSKAVGVTTQGRFPSNFIIDQQMAEELDYQTAGPAKDRGENDGSSSYYKTISYHPIDTPPFFYCSKEPKSKRNIGSERNGGENPHPTVKPIELMAYLVRLITPEDGVVLDPFFGSGTTAIACLLEGKNCIGIESKHDYFELAKNRVEYVKENYDEVYGQIFDEPFNQLSDDQKTETINHDFW